jgi:hypothetical protein
LLAWDTDPAPPARKENAWGKGKANLVLWPAALHQTLGIWPRTMSRYSFADGTTLTRKCSPIRDCEIRMAVEEILK